jgi:CHAD domain-containing protein
MLDQNDVPLADENLIGDNVSPGDGIANQTRPKRKRAGLKRLRVRPTDPLPEAGRAIMAFHFARLRKHEKAAARGDADGIHDMRVATRRIRAAFRIVRPYFRRKAVKFFLGELRALAGELGAARDLDVIIDHAQAFNDSRPLDAPKIDAWLDYLRAQRADAQRNLIDHLGSESFAQFVEEFGAFVAEPGAAVRAGDAPLGLPRVCDVIPAAIWQQYSHMRAHETIGDPPVETLHALRIEFKRLRYLLEFFQGVLGAGAARLIEATVQAQDHLGLLQDASVATSLLRQHIADNVMLGAVDLTGIADYLNALQVEIQTRRESFRPLYAEITGKTFRRQLARALSNV